MTSEAFTPDFHSAETSYLILDQDTGDELEIFDNIYEAKKWVDENETPNNVVITRDLVTGDASVDHITSDGGRTWRREITYYED